jgi:hypothetical protein
MPRKVKSSEAAIQTAAVEVKTIMVGERQMTLSLFRQLPMNRFWSSPESPEDQPQSHGEPWGFVNYHWKGCGAEFRDQRNGDRQVSRDTDDHVHLVFVSDGIICQCPLFLEEGQLGLASYRTDHRLHLWSPLHRHQYRDVIDAESRDLLGSLHQLFIAG